MKLSADQLDSLVAPIALYPDPLLAQTLAASTYPLEIVQLQQWLAKNPGLKDKALADAVAKQPWDPSIQSLAAVPELTKRLSDDIQWTADLGNAFLAQQSDVMDAVQRMRQKAQAKGALVSNEQQKVETTIVETKQVIIVEPTSPEVIYVPSYSPTVVYGPPVYAYPPVYYPPYTPGAAFVTFGVGMMVGAAIWGGTCCGCGWGHGHGNVNINVHNNYNRNSNINRNNNVNRAGNGNNNWQHNAQHRGGTPYADRNTANKYGGSARGDSLASRQQARGGGPSASNRMSTGRQPTSRPSGNYSSSSGGFADRASGGGRSSGSRGASAGTSDRSRGAGGGGDRIGGREIGGGNSSSRGGGFGNSNGFSGGNARASSSRGASSFGGGRGGGGGRRR